MTPEEEVKMLNEDHEIWKKSKEDARKASSINITDFPKMDIYNQLSDILSDWNIHHQDGRYKYSTFSGAAPIYIDRLNNVPLCTTNDHYAKLWVAQINEIIQEIREKTLEELIDMDMHMFSARCVDMYIDLIIGERDNKIAGMHYIGVVISHFGSERNNNYDIARECDACYESMFVTKGDDYE